MNQIEINEKEWENKTNWKWYGYFSAVDSRLWVSKQVKWMGWTINFGHQKYGKLMWRLSWAVALVGLSAAVVVPILARLKLLMKDGF